MLKIAKGSTGFESCSLCRAGAEDAAAGAGGAGTACCEGCWGRGWGGLKTSFWAEAICDDHCIIVIESHISNSKLVSCLSDSDRLETQL